MQQAFQVASASLYQGKKPLRSAQYLRFVKGFGCAACDGTRCVDPAHTGAHGIAQKSADYSAIPLCRKCHDAYDADPKGFAAAHHLNVSALIQKFNTLWEQRQRRTA